MNTYEVNGTAVAAILLLSVALMGAVVVYHSKDDIKRYKRMRKMAK